MQAYTGFAYVYDEYMDNIPYDEWSAYLIELLKENGIIKSRRSGKEVYYTLDDEHVSEVFEVALEHINHKKGELNEKI